MEIVARLDTMKEGKANKVTKKEREEVQSEWKKWAGVAKGRMKIAIEMWKLIEDVLPEGQSKAGVREALGLDD